MQDAVMAVGGVGVQRHIGDHADLRLGRFDRGDRPAHEVVAVEGLFAVLRLQILRHLWKQGDGRDAQPLGFGHRLAQQVDGQPVDAGHRGHRLPRALALHQEDRPDQIVRAQPVLRHHPAGPRIRPVATQTGAGVAAGMGEAWHGRSSGRGGRHCRHCDPRYLAQTRRCRIPGAPLRRPIRRRPPPVFRSDSCADAPGPAWRCKAPPRRPGPPARTG